MCLVNKPQVSGTITRWLLLFLEYEFTIVYKHGRIHVVVNVLCFKPDNSEPLGVLDQTTDASLFSINLVATLALARDQDKGVASVRAYK